MTRAIAWLSIAAVIGCGGGETPAAEYPPIQEEGEARPEGTEPTGEGSAAEAGPAEEPAAEAAAPIRVVAAERTGVLGTPPTLRIRMPPNGRLVRSGDVQLTLRLDDWELQPAPGAHLHLVIDNEPYIAIRDISRNLNVNALAREHLGHELAEGSHVLRLFLSRTNHESIKTEGSAATLLVHFRSRTPDFGFDADAPMLTYSRPKGCYESGSRVMLDFQLSNVEALSAEGTRIRFTIDGETSGEITSWAPHFIENLPDGEHRIRLQLLGADGAPIAGMFNDTERTIQLAPSCE